MGFFKNLSDKATLRKQVSELRLIERRLGELTAAQRLTLMSTIGESLAKVDGANVRSMTPDQQVVIGIRIQSGAHNALIGAFNEESLASWIVGTWLVVPHMPAGSDQATVEARVRMLCREAWEQYEAESDRIARAQLAARAWLSKQPKGG
ncbi:hypothetical protein ACSFA0_25160 [Variovorax sp. LT1P1]|uniref:hypothetical protein n=1 Tax=Variovorax sp. LT1P1 TaxID=3443730 RepID=UPI003F477E51